MYIYTSNFTKVTLLTFILVFSFSCSEDSELFDEYVADKPEKIVLKDINISTLANESIVIYPIDGETYTDPDKVSIVEVTPPKMGTIEIQADNTIVYTPDPEKTGTDDFDYTTSVTNPDDTASTQSGNISVTVTGNDKTGEIDLTQVNFSKYGAKGDGKTDDTKALQAAFDSEASLVGTPGAIYRITGSLNIDDAGDQKINFNGAKIIAGSTLSYMIRIEKPSGVTTFVNSELDGDLKAGGGMNIRSSFKIENVNIYDLHSSTQAVIGFYVSAKNNKNWTIAELKKSSAKNIRPVNNGVIGDVVGASRALQWEVTTDNGLQGLIEDCVFERAIGEDGDVFFWRLQGFDPVGSQVKLVVNRSEFKYGTRRVVKTQGGNLYFFNSTFTGISKSDPDFKTVHETGGFISLGGSTYGYDEYKDGRNFVFDGCTFNGSDFDKRIIYGNSAYDIAINNSVFNNGTEIRMWRGGGALCVSNSTFSPGSKIYHVDDSPPFNWKGPILLDNNNGLDKNFDQFSKAIPALLGNYQCIPYKNPNN